MPYCGTLFKKVLHIFKFINVNFLQIEIKLVKRYVVGVRVFSKNIVILAMRCSSLNILLVSSTSLFCFFCFFCLF